MSIVKAVSDVLGLENKKCTDVAATLLSDLRRLRIDPKRWIRERVEDAASQLLYIRHDEFTHARYGLTAEDLTELERLVVSLRSGTSDLNFMEKFFNYSGVVSLLLVDSIIQASREKPQFGSREQYSRDWVLRTAAERFADTYRVQHAVAPQP